MVQPDSRRRVVAEGALTALLVLVQGRRNVAARNMAQQALRLCSEDAAVRAQLESAAAARGLSSSQLTQLLSASINRLSSFGTWSASDTPSPSPSPHAAPGLGLHRRMPSDLPSTTTDGGSSGSLQLSPAPSMRPVGMPTTHLPDTPRMATAAGQGPTSTPFKDVGSSNSSTSAAVVDVEPEEEEAWEHISTMPTLDPVAGMPPASALAAQALNGSTAPAAGGRSRPKPLQVPSSPVALPLISPVLRDLEEEDLALAGEGGPAGALPATQQQEQPRQEQQQVWPQAPQIQPHQQPPQSGNGRANSGRKVSAKQVGLASCALAEPGH